MATRSKFSLIMILASSLSATTALAQTSTHDPVAELLKRQAPSASQTQAEPKPDVETEATRALNAGIVEHNLAAERQERNDANAYSRARETYEQDLAKVEAAQRQYQAEVEAIRNGDTEGQRQYERRLADWRATVAACERGDRVRCAGGVAALD